MKKIVLPLLLVLMSASVFSVGTFLEESDKEGPSAVYSLGIISEERIRVEVEVENRSGINISYPEEFVFEPGESDFSYWRDGSYVPGRLIEVNITSLDPDRPIYTMPAVIKFYDPGTEGSARVLQEREYRLFYGTDHEREYGFEGDLISEINGTGENEGSGGGEVEEGLSIADGNNTSGGEGEDQREGSSKLTLVLAVLLVLALIYTVRQILK